MLIPMFWRFQKSIWERWKRKFKLTRLCEMGGSIPVPCTPQIKPMRHCDATIMICKFACVFKFISPKTCLSPMMTTTFLTTKERLGKYKNFLILLWRSLGCIFPLKILYRIYFISRGRWYHPWNIVVGLKLHQEFFIIAHLSKFLHSDNHTNSINLFY